MKEPPKVKEASIPSLGNAVGGKDKNYRLYQRYSSDSNYRDVAYDSNTGGMKATHKGHNWKHDSKDKLRYFGTMTKEDLELECQQEIVRMGGSVIFRDESEKRSNGQTKTALDAVINGHLTDIRSVTSSGKTYKNQLESKNEQLRRWNKENPNERGRTIALYFHDPSMYSELKLTKGIRDLKRKRVNGRRINLQFDRVLAIVKGRNKIEEFEV